MPKIKDLGINIIPAAMRPPEIGGGGQWFQPSDASDCPDKCCEPPSARPDDRPPCGFRSFGDATSNTCYPPCCEHPSARPGYNAFWGTDTDPVVCNQDPTLPPVCCQHPSAVWAAGDFPTLPPNCCQHPSAWAAQVAANDPTLPPNCCQHPSAWAAQVGPGNTLPPECCQHPSAFVQTVNCLQQCVAGSHTITITPHTPKLPAGVLTRDDIKALREQLRQYLENVDAAAKNLLPKTLEDLDAREKELQTELEALKGRRSELKKS